MLERSSITALLGPTNTGKTHRAVERMLEHDNGMIGLPLRLLAREVFDRVTARIGEDHVALITGEEKRVPRRPSYWICTVEAMPIDHEVDFLAVDEVQLAAHAQRGHVFTERLLHARGRRETWFLGSDTMRSVLSELLPHAEQISHPRLSRLTYAGTSRIAKLPPRSVVVAFSTEHVHEIAERMKRAFGGVAVVLGALSPRTRNAQVAMFQAGEVDHLVATDAIGMGLNLALDHVAFASLRKFDGREQRELDVAEIGQIAGRAGRFRNDGTFGAVAPLMFPEALISQIEEHRFPSVRRLIWRNADLDFASVEDLLASLKRSSPSRLLRLVEAPEDTQALAALAQRPAIRERLTDPSRLRLLWDVCTVPDFRKLLFEAHVALLEELFLQLTGPSARLDESWLAEAVARTDDVRGDIDTILGRIAAIRTWTYVSYRSEWLASASHWQARTRDIEDRLSDALHAALVQRFVDPGRPRRGAPSVRVAARATISSERAPIAASPAHPFAALAALRTPSPTAPVPLSLHSTRHAWIEALVEAPYERFAIDPAGRIAFDGEIVGELVPGTRIVLPDVKLRGPEGLGGGAQARVLRRLVAFARDWVGRLLAPLREASLDALSPAGQQIVYRLDQSLGTVLTSSLDEIPTQLTTTDRAQLALADIVVGGTVTYATALLRPDTVRARATLCAAWFGRVRSPVAPSTPPPSYAPAAGVDPERYLLLGYLRVGSRLVRADCVEQVRDLCFLEGTDHVSPERLAAILGASPAEARRLMRAIAPDAPRTTGPSDTVVSKRLSYVLRHRPDEIGITLDPQGWIGIDALVAALGVHGLPLSVERIRHVVSTSEKQRFALSPDGLRIRANQGHSVSVALGYEAVEPPPHLFHGTARDRLADILRDGLVRGRRHDVHLSTDVEASRRVGARHGSPVVLRIDSAAMHRDGHTFTRSANGVWLTRRVPPEYIRIEAS